MVHFAKTTGAQFKSVMGGLEANDKTVLESAVRGEMGGYGAQQGGGGGAVPKRLGKISAKKF